MLTLERCYLILGVEADASPEEIKRAYRDLVREWHPDRLQHDARRQKQAEERLKEINVAYSQIEAMASGVMPSTRRPRTRPEPANGSAPPNGYSKYSAYRTYAGAPKMDDDEPRESAASRAYALYEEGMKEFRSGHLRDAVSSLVQSVCLHPDNADAHMTLGLSYRLLKMPAKAAAAFKQAIRFRPESEDAHNNLGQSFVEMGELKEAVWTCSQFLKRSPGAPDLYVTLGSAYRRQGKFPQAMEALQEAVRLRPASGEAHFELGRTYAEAGEERLARAEHETLRGLDDDLAVKLLLVILDR